MDMPLIEKFIIEVQDFKETLVLDKSIEIENINLKNLYNRDDNGSCTGSVDFKLERGTIIFLEGHYTLRSEFHKYIDFNIVLLGDKEEFLNRKIDRVKGYRSPDEAIDYYWKIDIPSFKNHLNRFAHLADLIIENTDYYNPVSCKRVDKKNETISSFLSTDKREYQLPPINSLEDLRSFFSFSDIGNVALIKLENFIKETIFFDKVVGNNFQASIKRENNNFSDQLDNLLIKKNLQFKKIKNNFHHIYRRILPITWARILESPGTNFNIIVLHKFDKLEINIFWAGGQRTINLKRPFAQIESSVNTLHSNLPDHLPFNKGLELKVFTPDKFLSPSFCRDFSVSFDLSQNYLTPLYHFMKFLKSDGLLIMKIDLYKEANFYKDVAEAVGGLTLLKGKYLFICRSGSNEFMRCFMSFSKRWSSFEKDYSIFEQAKASSDLLSLELAKEAYEYFSKSPLFLLKDNSLFFDHNIFTNSTDLESVTIESLKHSNPLIRKLIFDYINYYFPSIKLKLENHEISMEQLTSSYPSSFEDIYLWIQLREKSEALLATNTYDISPDDSIDATAYLSHAFKESIPCALQSSLNAIGHDTDLENGYLELDNGPIDFPDSIYKTVRKIKVEHGFKNGLYTIGLDHVAANKDKPRGRAQKFLHHLNSTGLIKHYVQDGSNLFDAKDESSEELAKAYKKIIDFNLSLEDPKELTHLLDLEICTGELNYIENTGKTFIPTVEHMNIFVDCFHEAIQEKNLTHLACKPILFIGNLGTTHHGADESEVSIDAAKDWNLVLQKRNFISPVLHGTTQSSTQILTRASQYCAKINIAGDLLYNFVNNLPEGLRSKLGKKKKDYKLYIKDIRSELRLLSHTDLIKIKNSLTEIYSSKLKAINAPNLSSASINFFQERYPRLTKQDAKIVANAIKLRIDNQVSLSTLPIITSLGNHFVPSMIEVPFNEFKEIVPKLVEDGTIYFHIDVGDGKFISREFSGLEKITYLKNNFPEMIVHCHIMAEEPHLKKTGENKSLLEQYIDSKSDKIAIHQRSFKNIEDYHKSIEQIKNAGLIPGIIIETSQEINQEFFDFILDKKIEWVLVMGVPIGYGGQEFHYEALIKLKALNTYFKKVDYKLLIEADGGLNEKNLLLCKQSGAQLLSGWSIIRDKNTELILKKLSRIKDSLSQDG